MKNIFFTLLMFVLFTLTGNAQDAQREKINAVKDKVVQFVNSKKADSLYNLAAESFKNQLPFENFETWCIDNIFPLGKIYTVDFKNIINGAAKYKVSFKKEVLSMLIGVDAKGKFNAFGFQPWEEEIVSITKSDNLLSSTIDKQVESIVQPFMNKSKTVGLSIGILKDGKTFFYNYGETKKGNGQIPSAKNLYEIGSITKTFTGILLALAVIEKRVKLNDPVNKYLPADIPVLKYGTDTIRLVHLSNHTSGLPRMPDNIDLSNTANPYKDYSVTQLFNFLKTVKLSKKPGTKIEYSNLGVGILGVILERLQMNRISYSNMVKKYICDKAEMGDTKQFLNKKTDLPLIQGYNENIIEQGAWDFLAFAAAGSLRSNAEDMIKYAAMNISVKDKNLQKAIELSHQITFEKDKEKIGLNWFIINLNGQDVLFHNGATGGYRSFLTVNLKTKNAVIILSNTAISNDALGIEIFKLIDN